MRHIALNNATEIESRQNRPPGLLSIITGGQLAGPLGGQGTGPFGGQLFGMYNERWKIKNVNLN